MVSDKVICSLLNFHFMHLEKLSIAINNAVTQGNLDLIHITNGGPQISHLLFADDVLLFTKAKKSQFRFITDLFDRFSRASGLKINISKSRALYSSGTPQEKITNLTSISGIRNTTSLGKYLGFPMLQGRPKRSDFNFIIEKMQTRLATWKNRLLNITGRLALATSVLSSIPSYYMQIIGFRKTFVILLIKQLVTLFGVVLATRVFTW